MAAGQRGAEDLEGAYSGDDVCGNQTGSGRPAPSAVTTTYVKWLTLRSVEVASVKSQL